MTLVGIAGCTALLLVAFGLRDSISDIIDNQWPAISHYDYIVGMTSDVSEEEADQINAELNQVGATNIHRITRENVLLESSTQKAGSLTRTTIMTSNSLQDLAGLATLRNRLSGQAIELGEDSVVITEKLAKRLGCRRGRIPFRSMLKTESETLLASQVRLLLQELPRITLGRICM